LLGRNVKVGKGAGVDVADVHPANMTNTKRLITHCFISSLLSVSFSSRVFELRLHILYIMPEQVLGEFPVQDYDALLSLDEKIITQRQVVLIFPLV
jgi:hypothetical protein